MIYIHISENLIGTLVNTLLLLSGAGKSYLLAVVILFLARLFQLDKENKEENGHSNVAITKLMLRYRPASCETLKRVFYTCRITKKCYFEPRFFLGTRYFLAVM